MQEKEGTADILENLERRKRVKRVTTITIVAILLVIVGVFIVLLLTYFKSPEKTLGIGANIESALLSQDGKISYVKLLGGSNDKNITKIKFIFTDAEGKEYVYETSEGIKEIEVPYSRSFWDWLFGRQLKGVYDYEINSDELGIENFNNINEVGVLFEYVTSEGTALNTTILDTTKPTNKTTTGGGGGGGGGGCTPTKTCLDYPQQCSSSLNDGCSNSLDCSNNCNNSYCYKGEGIKDVCVNNSVTCHDSDGINFSIKGNVSVCIGSGMGGGCYFSFDTCLDSKNVIDNYCYYNGTKFEIRNESYNCVYGCSNGACMTQTCTNDFGCSSVGSFCDINTNIPFSCTLNISDGCLDRVNGSECGSGYYCDAGICKQGNLYYVDANNGNDSWSGKASVWNGTDGPWKTLNRAYPYYPGSNPKVALGDTVYFRDGNYGAVVWNQRQFPVFTGDMNVPLPPETQWYTYKAQTGHTPVFESFMLGEANANYSSYLVRMVFDGITFYREPPAKKNIYVAHVVGMKFLNCIIYNSAITDAPNLNTGIECIQAGGRKNNDIVIENCTVHTFMRAINAKGNNIIIKDCNIYDAGDGFIMLSDSNNSLIEGNYIHDSNRPSDQHIDGIQIANCDNLTIRKNRIYNCQSGGIYFVGNLGQRYSNVLIENNLLYNIWSYCINTCNTNGLIVRYNTMLGNPTNPSHNTFGDDDGDVNVSIYGNIFGHAYRKLNITWVNHGYNLYTLWSTTPPENYSYQYDTFALFLADEVNLFTNPDANDFTLKAGSRAIDFGTNQWEYPSTDLAGNIRSGNPDAGCYEYAQPPDQNTFYVSITSSPSANGNQTNPFNLSQAQAHANTHLNDEITFLLEDGNYGEFSLTNVPTRTNWVNWKANGNVVFDKIIITGAYNNAYIRFDGVNVSQPNPNLDRNNPPWSVGYCIQLNANYIEVKNTDVTGWSQYLFHGFSIYGNNVKVEHCNIHNVWSGFEYLQGSNISVIGNHIHNFIGSGIRTKGNQDVNNILIEGNHIHTATFNVSDDFYPPDKLYINTSEFPQSKDPGFQIGEEIWHPATGTPVGGGTVLRYAWENGPYGYCWTVYLNKQWPGSGNFYNTEGRVYYESKSQTTNVIFTPAHGYEGHHQGSLLAIRSSNTTIRKNILHDWIGAAIKFYDDTGVPYTNMVVENNLAYDNGGLNLWDVNSPLIFRNNTIIGFIDNIYIDRSAIPQRYTNWMSVSFHSGYNGSGCKFYNNIFVGSRGCIPADDTDIDEDYNIFWSNGYSNVTKGAHSKIVVWRDSPREKPDDDYSPRGWPNFFEDIGYNTYFNGRTGPHICTTGEPPYDYDYARDGITPFFVNPGFQTNPKDISLNKDHGGDWDYHPLMFSPICNGGYVGTTKVLQGAIPGVAWAGALPCVCTQDSQCIDVFGSGTCNRSTGKCSLQVGSLSPFTKLWSFLKTLLTGKTGQAILTGKITGNAAGDGSSGRKSFVMVAGLIVVIITIVLLLKYRKAGRKKEIKRKRR